MIKAVLFDFYGVLYPDTFWGLADIFVHERDDNTQEKLHQIIKQVDLGTISEDEFWEQTAEQFGTNLDELMKEKDKLGDVDKNLLKLAQDLKLQGIKTGIISNAGTGFIENIIGKDVQDSCFDVVVLSGEEGIIKPDRRIFDTTCDKLALKAEQCLFFDDIQRNVDGAISAGMRSELYTGFNKCKKTIESLIN